MARTLTVSDMKCTGCEETVVDALREVDGIEDARADHEDDTVAVEGDASEDAVKTAIEEADYTVEG